MTEGDGCIGEADECGGEDGEDGEDGGDGDDDEDGEDDNGVDDVGGIVLGKFEILGTYDIGVSESSGLY